MGKITEATYYKELKKIRDKYAKLNSKDLKDDIENLDKELHDYDVAKAKKVFDEKSEKLIENFINQEDPVKNRKKNKKGYTFTEFKADYKKLIEEVKKVDKEAAKELEDNQDEYFENA